jgi:putative hemolysin
MCHLIRKKKEGKMKWISLFAVIVIMLSSCTTADPTQPAATTVLTDTPQTNMPNPASVFCEEQEYKVETTTAADGSQSSVCVFPDGTSCDEWAYYRGECKPAGEATAGTTDPTAIPTAMPINPADYQGFWTYTHAVYGFSIMLPEDWIVDETTTNDPLMNGHLLSLHPEDSVATQNIRMTFRTAGEDTLLWPTGVGQGEFISQGTLDVAGQPAQRILLVCPDGEITAIWYHQAEGLPNIARGDMEFGFIFSAGSHCEAGKSLSGKIQLVGEMIIASLKVPD